MYSSSHHNNVQFKKNVQQFVLKIYGQKQMDNQKDDKILSCLKYKQSAFMRLNELHQAHQGRQSFPIDLHGVWVPILDRMLLLPTCSYNSEHPLRPRFLMCPTFSIYHILCTPPPCSFTLYLYPFHHHIPKASTDLNVKLNARPPPLLHSITNKNTQ